MRIQPVLPLLAAVACASCGASPSSPSPSSSSPVGVGSFDGLWSGSYTTTYCDGDRQCIHTIGSSQSFTLRLVSSGAKVSGVFTVWGYAVPVEGDLLKDGTLNLAGEAPAAGSRDGLGSFTMRRLTLQSSPAAGILGDLAFEVRPLGDLAAYYTLKSVRGNIQQAVRQDLSMFAGSFTGKWMGRYIVRDCRPYGTYCYPSPEDELSTLELDLVQTGDGVEGTLNGTPIAGRVNGPTLTLDGESHAPSSGGETVVAIHGWTATRDRFGRMDGSFSYTYAWPSEAAPKLGESARAELWQVVKVP